MGKRRRHAMQRSIWVAAEDLPRSAAHPFYTRLNQILDTAEFDGYVENDPATFLSVAVILGFVALAACDVPARRASTRSWRSEASNRVRNRTSASRNQTRPATNRSILVGRNRGTAPE